MVCPGILVYGYVSSPFSLSLSPRLYNILTIYVLTAQSTECCSATSQDRNVQGSCFTSRKQNSKATIKEGAEKLERCMDPVPLFTHQHDLDIRASQSRHNITKYPRNIGGNIDTRGILVETTNTRHALVENANALKLLLGNVNMNVNARDLGNGGGTGGSNGSAYGTRCHVTCLRADGDEETYACVRPRIKNDEERLIRLEIEDPPWLQKQHYFSKPDQHDQDEGSTAGSYTKDSRGPNMRRLTLPPKHGQGPRRGPPPTRIIVYKGPPSEIIDHISIDVLRARSPLFPPARLPMFFRYVFRFLPTFISTFLHAPYHPQYFLILHLTYLLF